MTVHLRSPHEFSQLLPCLTPEALPALRTLCLAAAPGAGVRGALGPMRHGGLKRLVLHGVEAEGGFEGFDQLSGGHLNSPELAAACLAQLPACSAAASCTHMALLLCLLALQTVARPRRPGVAEPVL